MRPGRTLVFTALAATLALFSSASNAILITTSSANPYDFSWSYDTGASSLTGYGTLTVGGFNTNLLSVGVSLTNTSQIGGQGGERLVGFGFGIDPNAMSVGFLDPDGNDGGLINATWASGALVSNVPGVEVCAWGGVNCSGGSNGGIYAGTSDFFTVLLGGNWGSSVNIDPIGLRYQTGYGSFTFPSTKITKVPEPSTTTLLFIGFGVLSFGLLRRRSRAS